MKRQLETTTQAPPELEIQDGAESTPELLSAPQLLSASDTALQPPMQTRPTLPQSDAPTQALGFPKLRLLWANRHVTSQWAIAGFWSAILLTLIIPKQYVATSKLMSPETKSAEIWRCGSSRADLVRWPAIYWE